MGGVTCASNCQLIRVHPRFERSAIEDNWVVSAGGDGVVVASGEFLATIRKGAGVCTPLATPTPHAGRDCIRGPGGRSSTNPFTRGTIYLMDQVP